MRMLPLILCRAAALVPVGMALAAPALAHDYPTAERVLYVQDCMNAHSGPSFEMIHKCSCVIDRIAQEVSFDDYVEYSTASKAASIGGERGGVIRDSENLQQEIKRYRALQNAAEQGCFLRTGVR